MKRSAQWVIEDEPEMLGAEPPRRLSFLKFLVRYPIFLLAFGPPILRPPATYAGFDTSQAHFDLWSIFQVGWLALIALRAIRRLAFVHSIHFPRQIKSILKYPFFLGLLYLVSVTYSPGRTITAEYTFLYFLTFICVLDFLVDVHRNPPDWMQCIFHLRLISLLLFALVLLILPVRPVLVLGHGSGLGIRLLGLSVAATTLICPIIAIISAYAFLNSLESRTRSTFFFLVGLAGTLITQARGAEIPLFVVLVILGLASARTNKQTAYLLISGLMAFILLAGVVGEAIGGERVWDTFNRGQDIEGIQTLSGRTGVWVSLIEYSLSHPQGMGYIAGIRTFHGGVFAESMHATLTNIGGTDNAYLATLADAGWLALAFYLIMNLKTIAIGWRFAKKQEFDTLDPDRASRHALRCALLLLVFFLLEAMDGSDFAVPLRQPFYVQNIVFAIILGISGRLLITSGRRQFSSAR